MKKIFGILIAVAMVSVVFAGMASAAGEGIFVYGANTINGAKLTAWVPARSNEIVTDETGALGNWAADDGFAYDGGNYNTAWNGAGETTRNMICTAAGLTTSFNGVMTTGAGVLDLGSQDPVAMVVPTATINGLVVDLTWANPGDANIWGYLVYRSNNGGAGYNIIGGSSSNQAGFWWANPVANLERADTVVAALTYTDTVALGAVAGETYDYAIRYVYSGQIGGTNWGVPTQIHDANLGMPTAWTPVYSGDSNTITFPGAGPAGFAPEATVNAETGVVLNGIISNEFVTINVTFDDPEGVDVIGAEIEIPTGGATYAMTTVSAPGPSRTYTYQYDLPNGQLAGVPVNYRVHGQDTAEGWNATWTADSFTYADTTAPMISWLSQPSATLYTTQPANFQISYGDFAAVDLAVANTYISWQVNVGGFTNYALTNQSFAWGSFTNILTYSIPGSTFVDGDVIDYNAVLQDGNGNSIALAGGSFTVADAPPGVQDPYPIFGYVNLYNGVGGVYTPLTSTGGQLVTATWISSFDGSTLTRTDVVNNLGQFSIDLMNYTDTQQVWLTTTYEAPFNNAGYNYTTVELGAFPGGRQQNILCGIPYNVDIFTPVSGATTVPGAIIPTTYIWYDINGVQCRGYYTFADGPMIWYSGDTLFVPPAPYSFNGAVDAGTHNDNLMLFTGGPQYINISENGAAGINPYPTPGGAIQIPTTFVAGNVVLVNGFLKDWDNITLMVVSGGFDWKVVVGWNIVSVPQDPVNKGLIAGFDAYDALQYVYWQLQLAGGFTQLSLAARTGPSAYNVFDYGMAEALAFPMDGVNGYWVFSDRAAVCHFNSTNYSAWGVDNVINAVVGWNLLGFTHNYTGAVGWGAMPTAADFVVDGTVSLTPGLAAINKIVVTEWLEMAAPQWYNSYVDMTGFPGMATHNWVWDNGYSANNPGNGLFLWLEGPVTITFDTEF